MAAALTENGELLAWLRDVVDLCKPDDIYICDGSDAEYQRLCELLVKHRTFTRLNERLRPGCFLARSHPSDVARVEDRTYICTTSQEDAGPTNNWADADVMKLKIARIFRRSHGGAHHVRDPLLHGARGFALLARIGIEITDSPYVVVNMRIMTRMGRGAGGPRQGRELHPLPAFGRRAARAGPNGRPLAVRAGSRARSTSSISPKSPPSGHTVRATAAMHCWARSAWHSDRLRPWPARRAGWPSTC